MCKIVFCVFCPTFTPFISESCLIVSAKGSMAITKSLGDEGQPCLLDLLRGKAVDICPLVIILACGFL